MGKTFQLSCVFAALLTLPGCGDDGGDDQSSTGGSSGTGGGGPQGSAGKNTSAGSGNVAGSGSAVPGKPGEVGGCRMFPPEDAWNLDVSALSVDTALTNKVRALVGERNIHPDYGVDGQDLYGIPINVVPQTQALSDVVFEDYADESDPGPYPFPGPDAVIIEGNNPTACDGDCHLLVVQQGACMLYEGYACAYQDNAWHCANGAKWDLKKVGYGQREEGWTSADAAGLAIAPGLLRFDEVTKDHEVTHAVRFTLDCTDDSYVKPATHQAVPGGCDPNDGPPMGTRVRLAASFDTSGFTPSSKAVLDGMKKYGMILADNGSNFYFQGEANAGWTEDDIEPLKDVPASAFEVVLVP